MHSMGVNVSGQIASVIAGGLIMTFFMQEVKDEFYSDHFCEQPDLYIKGEVGLFFALGIIALSTKVLNRLFTDKE